MLYEPHSPAFGLWDTWIFQEGPRFHLFHLQRRRENIGCHSIEHAVSEDWVHWENLPTVLYQETGRDTWDSGWLMTGMTLQNPQDGKYYLFYGSMVGRIQRIGMAVSDDLITWHKHPANPILEAGGPYESDPRQALNYETAWRDPYVFYHAPDACFYAFICARVRGAQSDLGGGCVAVCRSQDLLKWDYLPPAYVSDILTCLEVPEVFALNGQHYLTYTTSYHFGTPYRVADPYHSTGSFYVVSDHLLTGYHAPEGDALLNGGLHDEPTNYVGRSFPVQGQPDKRWFAYHHVYPPQAGECVYGSLSAPKFLQAGADGALRLRYVPNALAPLAQPLPAPSDELSPDCPLALSPVTTQDGIFEATLAALYAGLCWRVGDGLQGTSAATGLWLAPNAPDGDLHLLLGSITFVEGHAQFGSPAVIRRLRACGLPLRVRAVVKGACVDVYVDDELHITHTYSPASVRAGGVGVYYAGLPKSRTVYDVVLQGLSS